MDPSKNAPDSTSLALDRTVLANERTYAAWIRTGLASLAAGLGIARFMLETMPLWGIRLIALPLIVFSGIAFFLAAWRYEHLHVGMAHLDVKTIPLAVVKLSSYVLIGCSLLAVAGLWLLNP
ncbi:MAG TPA: DUF202 domain-containing protein [Gammaproteobacteria bacterium]|nr:DUF202 domain-containing protein [Gammaproteobacteria bacterium]